MKTTRVSRVIGGTIAVAYMTFALFGCVNADRLLFQPQSPSYSEKLSGLKFVQAADGTRLAVLHLPNPSARHTLFYFHGNAEDLGDVTPILQRLHAAGFAVLAFDYRGYGQSGGHPSEQNVYDDTRAVLAHARTEFGIAPGQCIVLGRSVGSGPAVELAVREPIAGLVLMSPFKSAFRVVTNLKLLPFDRFDNLAKIRRVRCPILIFHGSADEVIPFEHGKAVFAAAPEPKRSVWLEGARHNDVFHVAGPRVIAELSAFEQSLPPKTGEPVR
jgi:abhydrolase domain-containing protein 17